MPIPAATVVCPQKEVVSSILGAEGWLSRAVEGHGEVETVHAESVQEVAFSEKKEKGLLVCILPYYSKLYPHEPIFPRQIHPCHIFVKSKLCQFGGKFFRCFFSKWKTTEIFAYFRFNLLLISIFSAVLKENANIS